MKIVPNQRFLDEHDEYLPDEEYDVPMEKGIYFCRNGWADSSEVLTAEGSVEPVDIDVHNASVAIKDSNG